MPKRNLFFGNWEGGIVKSRYGHLNLLRIVMALLVLGAGCDSNKNVEPRFENYYVKYYGDEGDQSGADMIVDSDGSMVLLGNSVLPSGSKSPFLVRVNPSGDVIWELEFGQNETAVDIEPIYRGAHQGGLVVVSNVGEIGQSMIRIWRVSPTGVILDSLTLSGPNLEGISQAAKSITSLQGQDGFIITGHAGAAFNSETSPEITGPSETDILALYVDDAFSLVDNIVSKGGEMNGSGVKVFELPNSAVSQLVLFSYTDRPFRSNTFGFNFSYDIIASGVPIGNLVGSEEDTEVLSAVIQTPLILGEGFLMVGTSSSGAVLQGDIYLVKFNSSFEYKGLDRKVSIGRGVECVSAAVAPSGYYILANDVVDADIKNILLVRVTPEGDVEWLKEFGAPDSEDTGSAIHTLPDGRIALLGTMDLKTRRKMALIVVNSNGAF